MQEIVYVYLKCKLTLYLSNFKQRSGFVNEKKFSINVNADYGIYT